MMPGPSGSARPLLPQQDPLVGSLCLGSLLAGRELLKAGPNSPAPSTNTSSPPRCQTSISDQRFSPLPFSLSLFFKVSPPSDSPAHRISSSHLLLKDSDGYTTLEHLNCVCKRRRKGRFSFCEERRKRRFTGHLPSVRYFQIRCLV